jgi:hypothetical protein
LLTLVFVSVMYVVFDDIQTAIGRLPGRGGAPAQEPSARRCSR